MYHKGLLHDMGDILLTVDKLAFIRISYPYKHIFTVLLSSESNHVCSQKISVRVGLTILTCAQSTSSTYLLNNKWLDMYHPFQSQCVQFVNNYDLLTPSTYIVPFRPVCLKD